MGIIKSAMPRIRYLNMHERQITSRTTIKQEGGGRWWWLKEQKY